MTLVHSCSGDEARLVMFLDDASDYVASWAVLGIGGIERAADATVAAVLAVALDRSGSEAAADAVELLADLGPDRVSHSDYVRAARANLTDGRWAGSVLSAVIARPAAELASDVRAWKPVSDYEEDLRLEAIAACERAG